MTDVVTFTPEHLAYEQNTIGMVGANDREYTIAELRAAFESAQKDPKTVFPAWAEAKNRPWKAPFQAVVKQDQVDILRSAIIFYDGDVPKIDIEPGGLACVTSKGYQCW